ncbi:Fe-S cluster assembly protein SufD [Geminicoccus roseus]|uniref:Fe-S cluster assembly protein SufD n=1 Tax=Geminicoccus roseus TaxID=404900 RepID=UPI0003FE18C7|nr:Fe-S cluster assembly protein SufD [Geminicoccus roseus]
MTSIARNRTVDPVPAFAEAFERLRGEAAGSSGKALEQRAAAFERFNALGVPTPRVENWKYTNAASLVNKPFGVAPRDSADASLVIPHFAGGHKARRLIMVNGRIVPQLSHIGGLPAGMVVRPLAHVLAESPELVDRAQIEGEPEHSFEALNRALTEDGAFITLDDGVAVDEPLQVISLLTPSSSAFMVHPRHVIRLGKGARLHAILTTVALGAGESLLNQVETVEIADDAELTLDRTSQHGDGRSSITRSRYALGSRSRLTQTTMALGGTLQRHEMEVRLRGTHSNATLNGLTMPRGTEHADTLIRMHHEQPDCESDQFYKTVADERGHAVFSGKIFVHKDAQRTNSYQKSTNLLLSDDAEIDAKPELEIYADDVKCSHGATCGDLDPAGLFYLRSRGLDEALARSMLTFAFTGEVFERIVDESVSHAARAMILARLPGGERLAELG